MRVERRGGKEHGGVWSAEPFLMGGGGGGGGARANHQIWIRLFL